MYAVQTIHNKIISKCCVCLPSLRVVVVFKALLAAKANMAEKQKLATIRHDPDTTTIRIKKQ